MTTETKLSKLSFQDPFKPDYNHNYAPNEASPDYVIDRNFPRWLRWAVSYVGYGWSDELYDKPGFVNFCKWLQWGIFDHLKTVALTVSWKGFHEELKEFHEDEGKTHLEIEDPDNSSLEWGDEIGGSDEFPHLMHCLYSEFRKPDYPEDRFLLMTQFGEVQCDMTAIWYAPRECRDLREAGRYMMREIRKAKKEWREFWAEYEKLYPLTEELEEWRG